MSDRYVEYHGLVIDFASNTFTPVYEPEEVQLVLEYVKRGDRVLVGGGGEGLVAAAAAYRSSTYTAVYEANQHLAHLLKSNVMPSSGQFDVFNVAIDDSTGPGNLVHGESWATARLSETPQPGSCRVVRLDINAALADAQANVLILDIEGAEYRVLPAIKPEFWQRLDCLIVELHVFQPSGGLATVQQVIDLIEDNGMQVLEVQQKDVPAATLSHRRAMGFVEPEDEIIYPQGQVVFITAVSSARRSDIAIPF